MVKPKGSLSEDYVINYARGSLRAYLLSRQDLSWLNGMLDYAFKLGLEAEDLTSIFSQLENYNKRDRFEDAVKLCKQKGWLI